MRSPKLLLPTLLAVSFVVAPALAQEGSKKKADAAAEKSSSSSEETKHDPQNITGISPFMEKLAKGHKQVVARDFQGAIETYRSAITEDEKNPKGHYYLGAAQLLKGDLGEAGASWQTGLRSVGTDENTQGKLLFAMADLSERQGKVEEAKSAWAAYGKFVAEHPRAKGYAATAGERQKVVEKRQELEKQYGEVRKRIADREKELKDKQQAEAAKDADEEAKKGKKLPPTRLRAGVALGHPQSRHEAARSAFGVHDDARTRFGPRRASPNDAPVRLFRIAIPVCVSAALPLAE